uniref:Uncharacterized protein n=1 Tax=Peronospora matthiolae TaxID=2874970 RepID=A0AAV1TXZ3_9STRA
MLSPESHTRGQTSFHYVTHHWTPGRLGRLPQSALLPLHNNNGNHAQSHRRTYTREERRPIQKVTANSTTTTTSPLSRWIVHTQKKKGQRLSSESAARVPSI